MRPRVLSLLVLVLLAGCGRDEEVFSTTLSADGLWVLRVTVARSRMPAGPFYVNAYLHRAGQPPGPRLLETRLDNDGVPFTARNIAARWIAAGSALLCLRASDRPDRGWRFEIGPPPRAVQVPSC